MKLTLDGKQIRTAEFGEDTLSDLIRNLEQKIAPERVIVSMTLDGEPLDQTGEAAKAGVPVDELDSLEVNTQEVATLARNTLNSLMDYLPRLVRGVDGCVEMLNGADEKEGHLALGDLIDGLQLVSSAWRGIAMFINIKDREPGEMMPDMQEFSDVLDYIVQAQENGDTVRLCDLLEFELKPILDSWLEHANELATALDISA